MLWTFVAFIAILASVILHLLKKVIKTIAENYFIYPSDAEIDQILPVVWMENGAILFEIYLKIIQILLSDYYPYHDCCKYIYYLLI